MALIDTLRKVAKKRAKTQQHFLLSINAGTNDRKRILALLDIVLQHGFDFSVRNTTIKRVYPEVRHLGIVIHDVGVNLSALDLNEMLTTEDKNTRRLGMAIQKNDLSFYTSDT